MRIYILATACGLLSACSNHPIIDDVADLSTHDIVAKVKCEAQLALAAFANKRNYSKSKAELAEDDREIENLQKSLKDLKEKYDVDTNILLGLNEEIDRVRRAYMFTQRRIESLAREVAALLKLLKEHPEMGAELADRIERLIRDKNETQEQFERVRFDREVLEEQITKVQGETGKYRGIEKKITTLSTERAKRYMQLLAFDHTAMAMQFRFEITENNSATASGSLIWPVHLGTFGIVYNAGDVKKRLGKRVVKVAATFSEIIALKCTEPLADAFARRYPITGNIGIGELIMQYLQVIAANKLSPGQSFTDTIQFTTTINAGVNPSVDLKNLHAVVIKGGANLSADRSDIHEVIVDIAPPETSTKPANVAGLRVESLPEMNVRLEGDPDGFVVRLRQSR